MVIRTERRVELLTDWVKQKHSGQVKKYNGEPYFAHVLAVAKMAEPATKLGYEIGVCHDLLEDTGTIAHELFDSLVNFGYDDTEANYITDRVVELTDVFTLATYPNLSRAERKEMEAVRLETISTAAQTVKYCDLIYNINLVLKYETEHVEQYLKKKQLMLLGMAGGDNSLYKQVLGLINMGLKTLHSA